MTIGVLSDTHGHLYQEVARALAGVDHIIHAGDVGSAEVLAGLKRIAPLTAVRGNCDLDAWAESLPIKAELEIGDARILIGHVLAKLEHRAELSSGGAKGDYAAVVSGHSHLAALEQRAGVLYLNPGAAGPGRFGRPRTIARLTICPAAGRPDGVPRLDAEIVVVPS